MRSIILWVIVTVLVGISALEAGWIIRDRQKDDTRETIIKLERKFTNHEGRIVVLEGPPTLKKSFGGQAPIRKDK